MNATTIRQTLETVALDKLGAEFKRLPKLFDLEGNDDRSLTAGVSAVWGEMTPNYAVDQALAVDQDFSLKIAFRTFVGTNDEKALARVDAIYDSVSEILKSSVSDRLGFTGEIYNVKLAGVSAPQPFNNNSRDAIVIEVRLSVSYLIT